MNQRLIVRLIGWGVALVVIALPLVGLLNGWIAVDRWPVRSLRIDAPFAHVGAEQIRATAAPLLNRGFFAVDLGRVQQAVAALPWVDRVEVRKRWPDQVLVRVQEQRPFAHWNRDLLINRQGEVFAVPDAAALQGLPRLSGPDSETDTVLRFYLDMLARFGGADLPIRGVHLSARGTWRLALANGARVMVGHDDVERRLDRFLDTWHILAADNGSFDYVDLRYSNGYAVRWSETPSATGTTPST